MPIPPELKRLATRFGKCISKSGKVEICKSAWDRKKKSRQFNKERAAKTLQEEVFRDLCDLKRAGRKITLMELIAVRAKRDGLQGKPLLDNVNAIVALTQTGVIVKPRWAARLCGPARRNLSSMVNEKLEHNVSALSTSELMSTLFYPAPTISQRNEFNIVLSLLETMSLITKLPTHSSTNNVHGWIHNSHRWTAHSVPVWNLKFALLNVLAKEGPMNITDLMQRPEILELVSVSENKLFGIRAGNVKGPLNDLVENTLIRVKKGAARNGRLINIYELTAFAKEQLDLTEEIRALPERLRRSLLSQKIEGLALYEENRLFDFIRCLDILRERETGAGRCFIAKRLHEAPTYVQAVLHGVRPWKLLSQETKNAKYIPAMREHFPEYAELFIKYSSLEGSQPTPLNS